MVWKEGVGVGHFLIFPYCLKWLVLNLDGTLEYPRELVNQSLGQGPRDWILKAPQVILKYIQSWEPSFQVLTIYSLIHSPFIAHFLMSAQSKVIVMMLNEILQFPPKMVQVSKSIQWTSVQQTCIRFLRMTGTMLDTEETEMTASPAVSLLYFSGWYV